MTIPREVLIFCLIGLVIFDVLFASSAIVTAYYNLRYRYVLNIDGSASISVIVDGISGEGTIRIGLERGYIENSLMVFSSEGMPLPSRITPEGEVELDVSGLSDVTVEYDAYVGVVYEEVVINVIIQPSGPAEVVLPPNSALLYFNGTPNVETRSDSSGRYVYVILKFDSGGVYEIRYLILSLATTPTSLTTATPPGEAGVNTFSLLLILIIIAILALILFIIIRRRIRGYAPTEPLIETGFDERDKVILKVLSSGEIALTELAEATGLNKSVVWRRLEKLRSLGLVEKGYSHGKSVYRLTSKGLKVLKELGPE
ncbi:MAG: winged helix-turn-helix domain-containing protein [Zestosphaera sp.]